MAEKSLQIGRPVLLAGFWAASDQDFPRRPEGQPVITLGSICCYDRDLSWQLLRIKELGQMSLLL